MVIMGRGKMAHRKKIEIKALLEVDLRVSQRQVGRVPKVCQKCVFGV